jgi:hypothetical protein
VGEAGLDWKFYFYTKLMCVLSSDPQHAARELEECVQYLNNFINTIKPLNLAGGSILDVASRPRPVPWKVWRALRNRI